MLPVDLSIAYNDVGNSQSQNFGSSSASLEGKESKPPLPPSASPVPIYQEVVHGILVDERQLPQRPRSFRLPATRSSRALDADSTVSDNSFGNGSGRSGHVWAVLQNRHSSTGDRELFSGLSSLAPSLNNLPSSINTEGHQNHPSESYPYPIQINESGSSGESRGVRFGTNPTRSNSGHSTDPESAHYESILEKRKSGGYEAWKQWWDNEIHRWQRFFIIWSIIVSLVAVLALIVLLGLTKSKKMGRGSLTGAVVVVSAMVTSGMWAGGRPVVEILIAGNMVVVWGIFLTSQVDALTGFT